MIKRAVLINTATREIKPIFVDLDKVYERYVACQSYDIAEIPFGGKVFVYVDELAAYRISQTWCTVGVFPLPFGGQFIFFEKDDEGNVSDFMRTEAFFREFVNWISPDEAKGFLIANNLVPPQAFGTLDKPKIKPEVSYLRVVK